MKAIGYLKYGPPEVLHTVEIPKPAPRDHEVLVRVHATTVTIGDTIMRSLNLPVQGLQKILGRLFLGWSKPRRPILGMELAGEVEAIGKSVTRFKPGDRIFASTCDHDFGGYAEYKCLPEDGVIDIKPTNLTYEEAAAVTGAGMTTWRCLFKANLQPGQKILIYGASGAVGTNAVQIARHHFGADVTGVCSAGNMGLVNSLGAGEVIDYTRSDFTLGSEIYDVVFDAVGKLPRSLGEKALKPGGVYLHVHIDSGRRENPEHLQILKELIEAGKLKPVIDRVYPLDHIVEAHRYVDQGHKKGNVVVTLIPSGKPRR